MLLKFLREALPWVKERHRVRGDMCMDDEMVLFGWSTTRQKSHVWLWTLDTCLASEALQD
jgi:hypothetical protein